VIPAGTILDNRYEILGLIAEGGMGAVYRARRTRLGDEVAVKIVRPADDSRTLRERFIRESRAAAGLHHPNIVSILDYSVDGEGRPFLVMELLSGPSLRQEIAAAGALGADAVRRFIPPICTALQMAHDAGIIHRDIKPANIVAHRFGAGERAYKLVDFGLAALKDTADETRLTGAFMFVGTVAYAAPEQVEGQALDARTDVFSLASVVYEMLTGRPPYGAGGVYETLTKQASGTVVAPSQIQPGLPSSLDEIVLKGLARDRNARWASAAELGRALGSTVDASTATAVGVAPGIGGFASRYEFGAPLGKGRLGSAVHSGLHRALRHPVAIRTRRRGAERNWDAIRSRFLKEAQALQISHPSILQVRDFGEEGDTLYVVTELVEGKSLRETIAEGPLRWDRLQPLVSQLADAASALARRGTLVSGLSPEIVRLTRDGDEQRLLISSPGIHHLGDLLATLDEATLRGGTLEPELRYLAPEVLTGSPPDARSDVFTIGTLAFEMATGKPAFGAATLPALIGQMLREATPDPRPHAPELPDSAAAAIQTCLAEHPRDRFESAAAFEREWRSLTGA
jgi:serine/threonine protein kinase